MTKLSISIILICYLLVTAKSNAQKNYLDYHAIVIECEQLIVKGKYTSATEKLDSLFEAFDFLFLREIKIATELSVFQKDYASAFKFIKLGFKHGWTTESINKSDNLKILKEQREWHQIMASYDSIHNIYLSQINRQVKEKVHEMFKKDQKKAFGALLRIGQKSKRKYAENKFAPHSERQLEKLDEILNEYGYPGERLIGNNLWCSVILSHHNSISVPYNTKDTLYSVIKPKLMKALQKGEISPYEFAQIEDWKIAALNNHKLTSYGFLGTISDNKILKMVNKNRSNIGLRSIELRNNLIDVENKTGINLYLPKGWQNEKILIKKQ